MREGLGLLGRIVGEFAEAAREAAAWDEPDPLEPKRGLLRPPGAVAGDLFETLCTRCDDCIMACPEDVLFRVPDEYGAAGGTPTFNPSRKACFLCSDLHCIEACKEGALEAPLSIKEINIGKARLDPSRCIAYEGMSCRVCVDMCPLSGEAMTVLGERPVIKALDCVGCGLCQYYCEREIGRRAIEILPPTVDQPADEVF